MSVNLCGLCVLCEKIQLTGFTKMEELFQLRILIEQGHYDEAL